MERTHSRNVCIVVLGDIGRSPRMENHASSFIQQNINVDFIGYVESKPLPELLHSRTHCKIHSLKQVPDLPLPSILKLIFKTFWQTFSLLISLLLIRPPSLLLVQNPPGIPTLVICYLYCKVVRSKFIIDWHNYTYTVLALGMSRGERSLLCRVAKKIEHYFGSRADAHFCVTKAMQEDLLNKWHIRNVTVLYDRPPLQFHPIDIVEKHNTFMKLSKEYPQILAKFNKSEALPPKAVESTWVTYKLLSGEVLYKPNRMAILVSSTSWTPDEDFSTLLKALKEYEKTSTQHSNDFPSLLCIITGKGPQKEHYLKKIAQLNWLKVGIITPWLEVEDYPKVLAAADLGVCLHYSSSGLDLPMKVVDMFGCGLPVCAYNFNCLNELVIHKENGFVFKNAQQLAEQLQTWFKHFPHNETINQTQSEFGNKLKEYQTLRWHDNWSLCALPIFNKYF